MALEQLLATLALHKAFLPSIGQRDALYVAFNRYSLLPACHPLHTDHVDNLSLTLTYVFT